MELFIDFKKNSFKFQRHYLKNENITKIYELEKLLNSIESLSILGTYFFFMIYNKKICPLICILK